jgi:GT2 family glycosyltransferase
MRITIALLAWNNWHDSEACLHSLRKCEGEFKVLLVDNGSTDGTPERAREQFPEVEVLELGENLGVAGGYNRGMAHAFARGAEAVLVLNNDTMADPRLVVELARGLLEEAGAGVALPKIYIHNEQEPYSNRLWFAGAYHRRFPPAHKMTGTNKHDREEYSVPREISFAPSCCMLISRETYEKTGGFDERYHFFYDDWDFCVRPREAGFRILYQPTAILWHKVAQSTMRSSKPMGWWRVYGQSAVRYYRDHSNPLVLGVHLLWITSRETIKGNVRYVLPFWQGALSQLRHG